MSLLLIMVLTLLTSVFQANLAQPNVVDIKSHKVLTKGIDSNLVNGIYDKNESTIGSFYSVNRKFVEVEFDLGKNYLIDHVVILLKREQQIHNVSLSVGNSLNDEMRLPYHCERPIESEEIYKCQPVCRTANTSRPGIIARKFIMKLFVPGKWISVYSARVYSMPALISDDISNNRLVLPIACPGYSWLLTNRTSVSEKAIATATATDIYFEKPYVVTELDVQFENIAPKTLEILMISGQNQKNSLVINLSDCTSQRSIFSCVINDKTFSSTHVRIVTTGLAKIFIRGKPAFYPKLKMETSVNVKEELKMTCSYIPCDSSVHSDCSPEAIKSGLQFECANKQLIRLPSGSDKDSYIIANQGKLEAVWQNTKFTVDSNDNDRMIVSMPRSYQYFGQYKCACIVGDKMSTEIASGVTELKETDFLEDLIFKTLIQYKLSDSEDAALNNVSDNIIYLSKSSLGTSFLPVQITMFSLLNEITIDTTFSINEKENDSTQMERSTPYSIKAFETIPQSWSVDTQKYVVDDIFPEMIHQRGIHISCYNKNHGLKQTEVVTMLDEDKVVTKPTMWSTNDGKTMQVRLMYANAKEVKLYQKESSCSGNKTKVLATFTKKECMPSDLKLSCSKFKNATFVLFTDAANFANKVVFDLVSSENNKSIDNVTIKSNVMLAQNDVVLKHRYIGLTTSTKNKDANVVKVQIDVISRKIADFIPCGNVLVKIMTADKNRQEMILQKSNFNLDLEVTSGQMNVTIEILIDGAQGKHVSNLQIRDPATFGVSDVKLQGDNEVSVHWNGIEETASELLESYQLNIQTKTLACNSTTTEVKSISKSQALAAKNTYQALMAPVSKKHVVTLSVSIQPVFKGDKRGQIKSIEKRFNSIASSVISIDNAMHTTERTVTVIPSQTGISCAVKNVVFSVTGDNVEKFQWSSVSLGNMKYKIVNLVPGRTYQLTVKVAYENGPEDVVSSPYTFETSDDITIVKTKHFAQINEKVNISCTAEIGPEDKFKKTVGWFRADKSVLPDGVRSVISAYNPKIAFLIMEKTLADYSGEYACFASPSAAAGSMKMTIVVNDLALSRNEELVDFSYKVANVSVTCSSFSGGDTKLMWIDPSGSDIMEGNTAKYSVTNFITDQNIHKSTLIIKEVSLVNSGTYQCHKSIGNVKATKDFLLYGNEKISIQALPSSSFLVGEKIKLRCTAEAGLSTQKVMWQIVPSKDGDLATAMNTSYPVATDHLTQDLEITGTLMSSPVTCKLTPALKDDKEPLTKTYTIQLKSKIEVQGPTEATLGSDVKLTCLGYPASPNMQLKWIFYQKDENSTNKVVKVSEAAPSDSTSGPIKLELNLPKVDVTEAGRYECKFKQEVKGGGIKLGKSLSLAINILTNPIGPEKPINPSGQDKGPKSAQTALSKSPMVYVLAIIVLLSVYHRS